MRNSKIINTFIAILLSIVLVPTLFPVSLPAEDSAKDIVERVQKKYAEINDAILRFSQKAMFSLSKAEYTSSGVLYMKKTNHYRIVTDDRTFVTDGKTVWSYSPANKQVLVDTYKEEPRTFSPEKFLLNVPTDYYSAIISREKFQGKDVVVLKLTPKSDDASMKSLKLWVDDGEWLLWKAEVVDMNDNLTQYTVSDIRLNPTLADSTFTFVTPPGVEVVDLR
jgi:outer membrane lipoprotein carrier protein